MTTVLRLFPAIRREPRLDKAMIATSRSRAMRVASVLVDQIHYSRTASDACYRPGLTQWPPISYERIGGLWPTAHYLHTPPHPPSRAAAIGLWAVKRITRCIDFNFYCNAWILQNLLEAQGLADTPILTDEQLACTADAMIRTFRDPADPRPAAIYFWPRRIPAAGGGTVNASLPTNLAAKIGTFRALSKLGLGQRFAKSSRFLCPENLNGIQRALTIPADFDDASLFLSIGLHIAERAEIYPLSSSLGLHTDVGNFVALLLRHAYRPFSSDLAQSTIDTRTYFWLRHFLRDVASQASEDGREPSLILSTTWMQTLDEARRATVEKGPHRIPKCMNNVDLSVCANVLHALTVALSTQGSPEWLSPEVEQLYADTARLVAWAIESGAVSDRPDLALVYYPDVETFYWFAARALGRMRAAVKRGVRRQIVDSALQGVERAMRTATRKLVESSSTDDEGRVYWDGVLGNAEDRVYATAAAVNCLCETWTTRSNGRLHLAPDTPADVRKTMRLACEFLVRHSTSGAYPLRNAFFTGSIKSEWTFMWRYPANTVLNMDGRKLDPGGMSLGDIRCASTTLGMTGLIPEEEYQGLLAQRQFGLSPGVERHPFSEFCHWSDPNVIRSMCLLALTKYAHLCADLG